MSNRIGIDLGGTKIDAITLSATDETLFDKRVATPKTYEGVVAAIADLVREAGDGSVGIGAPGSNSRVTGLWRNANILFCNGKPFQRDLEAVIGRPVKMENDANCFALSEAIDGAGQGQAVVAFFTVGTALGGGLVMNGKLVVGANGEAGEFGHTALPWPNDSEWPMLPCYCGKKGCAEQYVSGTGLQRDHTHVTGEDISSKEIVARARRGDAKAQGSLQRLQDRFARIAANIACVVDPDVFVIGGGLNELPELVEQLPPLISRYSFSGTAVAKVVRAKHGEKSGVRGAAMLWDRPMLRATIRDERLEDIPAIYDLTKRAFAPMPFAGGNEQDLINTARDAGALSISLVAEIGSRIVGHVAFTPAMAADNTLGWFGLGPVAVEPELQRKGIGQQLINEGLRKLRAWNAAGCIVVGDPNYYQRFGFRLSPALTPASQPPEYYMMLSLTALQPNAVVDFHPLFSEGEAQQQ